MKKIPLKYLKEHLAEVAEAAAGGTPIEVTKYQKPYFQMLPCRTPSVIHGRYHGVRTLRPAVSRTGTDGRALRALQDDRKERS